MCRRSLSGVAVAGEPKALHNRLLCCLPNLHTGFCRNRCPSCGQPAHRFLQKPVCRLGKQQSKRLCSALGSPATARPLKGRLHKSPPPKSTKLHFSRAGPCFSGHTISHQIEEHVKTRQRTKIERNCAPFRAHSRERGRPKGSKKWSCAVNMPSFCLATQFYSGGAERAERHEEHPSLARRHFSPTVEGPLSAMQPRPQAGAKRRDTSSSRRAQGAREAAVLSRPRSTYLG